MYLLDGRHVTVLTREQALRSCDPAVTNAAGRCLKNVTIASDQGMRLMFRLDPEKVAEPQK